MRTLWLLFMETEALSLALLLPRGVRHLCPLARDSLSLRTPRSSLPTCCVKEPVCPEALCGAHAPDVFIL